MSFDGIMKNIRCVNPFCYLRTVINLEIKAYAKLNLFLKITGTRPDGYHNLDSIMQSISLHDIVEILPAEALEVTFSQMDVPSDNTAVSAAKLFFEKTGIESGAKIHITKNIPMKSGMGGSSADAAAVLKGLNKMFDNPLSETELYELGLKIGADVPFCLMGGCCRARGIGEVLEPLENNLNAYYLLLKPKRGIDTKEAYRKYERIYKYDDHEYKPCFEAMVSGDLQKFKKHTGNSLWHAAVHLCPEIRAILQALENCGKCAHVITGSGSTCVGIFASEADAKSMQQMLLNWDLDVNRIEVGVDRV